MQSLSKTGANKQFGVLDIWRNARGVKSKPPPMTHKPNHRSYCKRKCDIQKIKAILVLFLLENLKEKADGRKALFP